MPLPRCFFSITINGVPSGRIVFELFCDECPKTCENFRYLCTGEKGEGKTTFKPMHYKGTPIHRIVKGFIIQGGDFSNGDGTGGESIYGGMFEDESLKLRHDRPFLLSMANKGPDTNGSQFFITTRPAPHLDSLHVVFGHVIQGKQYVSEIENQKVDANHRPYADVRISNCGELVLLKAGKTGKKKRRRVEVSSESSSSEESSSNDESGSESSSSEEERKRRRKRQKKKKLKKEQEKIKKEKKKGKTKKARKNTKRKKKERLSPSSSSSSQSPSESVVEEPLATEEVVTSTIATEEDLPPEIISTSRSWLYRYSKSPSPEDEKEERRKQPQETVFKRRDNQVSNSGRKLKGRGLMRYRTPPRYGNSANWRYQSDWKGSRERTSRRQHSLSPSRNKNRSMSPRQHSPNPSRKKNRSMSPSARRHRVAESTQRYAQRRDAEPMSREYFPSRSRSAERCNFDSNDESLSLHSTNKKHRRECPDHDEMRRSSKWDKRVIPSHSSSSYSKRSSHHKSKRGPERPQRRSTSSEDSTSISRPTSRKLAPSEQTSLQRKYPEQYSDSDHAASSPITRNVLPSKWARHRDSDNDSTCTSDEDRELEVAYQQAQRTSGKDIFGIAELSQQYFNN